jgi:C-terminal processing protease CtpA/Prc
MADYNAWAGPYGLHLPSRPGSLGLSRTDERLWSTIVDDADALYVQYNRVELPTLDSIKAIEAGIARPDVQRVVLDLRQNYGGEVDSDKPLRDVLISYGKTNPGRLFVLTGRNTFSAGSLLVTALVDEAGARIVGEPMAGASAFWGNDRAVALPYSKLAVLVSQSSSNEPSTATDPLILEPDISAPMASTDYFADRDPALEAALGAP